MVWIFVSNEYISYWKISISSVFSPPSYARTMISTCTSSIMILFLFICFTCKLSYFVCVCVFTSHWVHKFNIIIEQDQTLMTFWIWTADKCTGEIFRLLWDFYLWSGIDIFMNKNKYKRMCVLQLCQHVHWLFIRGGNSF